MGSRARRSTLTNSPRQDHAGQDEQPDHLDPQPRPAAACLDDAEQQGRDAGREEAESGLVDGEGPALDIFPRQGRSPIKAMASSPKGTLMKNTHRQDA